MDIYGNALTLVEPRPPFKSDAEEWGTFPIARQRCLRHVGLARVSGGRRLEVVAAATDSASRCAQERQYHTDDEQDDSHGTSGSRRRRQR